MLLFSASGTGAMESAVANLAGAGRPRRGRRRGRVRRALGRDLRAARPRRAAHRLRVGRGPVAGRDRRRGRRERRRRRLLHAVRDLDRRRRRREAHQGRRRRRGRSSSTRSRRSAPCRSRPTPGAIDVVVSGSQKALMCPPGPRDGERRRAALGRRCRRRAASTSTGAATRQGAARSFDSAFTPAVSLIRGLDVALGMILDDGLEAAFERHVRLGRAARAGRQGDGARALLARRRHLRGRHRRRACPRASTRPSCCATCATCTASRSLRARAT